ncbi:MAG TPA: tetratricopeptide repeat protein [Oligoflexus sp.]|uniref:tetratricopeptide repeat protein n=1 Tax=Oligoflexus sp. TaxID=1971216 RepID=UPI002D256583|nr:tetratricopeptide repeat protein [Oligoflexus sp.]HYX33112.1 tetratricopeptide repeat protein [Oligoflexus sp.]
MSEKKSLAEEYGIKVDAQLGHEDPIMLIEDQQDLRLIVAHHLNKLGFATIKQFTNGHEALHFMKDNPTLNFSVTICDKEMPVLGGYDFLSEIKENPQYSRGAFTISLGNPDKEEIMLATESGVDEILVKPFTLKDLVPKLRNAHKKFNNPNNPEQVYELAKAELRAGNLDKSEHIFERLAQSAKGAARPLVGLARIASEKKDFEKALKFLEEAGTRNKFYVLAYVERGRIFTKQNKIDEAIEQFKQAIDLSPLNPLRYEEAAELLFKKQRYQEAATLLTMALDKELSFPSLHNYLSQAFYSLKDYKKAIRHIKSALSVEPENITFLNQLGICYKESDQFEEASKTYNTVIKLDPSNKAALYNKSVMLSAKGQHDEAIKLIKRCIEKHPDFEAAKRKLQEIEARAHDKAAS